MIELPDQGSNQTSSQSSENRQKSKGNQKNKSILYEIDFFPITTSPWIASIPFIFHLFVIVHSIDYYAENMKKIFPLQQNTILVSQFITTQITKISFIITPLLSIISLLSLFKSQDTGSGIVYIFGWIGKKVFPILRYIIEANLAFTALFFIRDPWVAPFFVLAAAVNIFATFFGQNYTLRKDYLCCKSLPFLMCFKSALILAYLLNSISFYVINSEEDKLQMSIFLSLHLILSLSLFISLNTFGYIIYRHSVAQVLTIIVVNLYFGLSLANFYDGIVTIVTQKITQNNNLIIALCFFILLCFLQVSIWSSLKKTSTISTQKMRKRIFFIYNKFQNSSQNINNDCEIRGIICSHLKQPCNNTQCFVNRSQECFYDSKKAKNCYPTKINQGKGSFIKFIIKCIYEQELKKCNWQDTDLLIQYIQFYYLKLKNVFKTTILINQVKKRFQTPFQKLRLNRLRKVMHEQNVKINKQLYSGNLQLEELIFSQQKFQEIKNQLAETLKCNISFWKYLNNEQINLSQMAQLVHPNLSLIDEINKNWKEIAKYFELQKIWKFYYACYTLYIKNQKLKTQFIESFGQQAHENDIFSNQSQHLDSAESSKNFSPKMIFQRSVCCIHINNHEERPIIKSVSRYCQKIFKYKKNEILESPLEILMTPTIQNIHQEKFLQWAVKGKPNNQINYSVKKVFPVTKDKYIIPMYKFYKQFQSIEEQLQYIALMKKNESEESVILLNANYQVEGMTSCLLDKFNLSEYSYEHLLGVNWLIFMPNLLAVTQLNNQINFGEDQKSMVSRGNYNKFGSKEITKDNIKLFIPDSFKQIYDMYRQKYKKSTQNDKSNIISQIRSNFLENQSYKIYTLQIDIIFKYFDNSNNSLIQISIREITSDNKQQNKLEKSSRNIARSITVTKPLLNQFEDKVIEEDFKNFFQSTQSSQNISLSFADNIFIKEQNNQPVQMISHAKSVALYVRIIFIAFCGLLLGNLLIQFENYDQYDNFSGQLHQLMKFQIKGFELNNIIYSGILNIQGGKKRLEVLTTQIRAVRNHLAFRKAILDERINNSVDYFQYGDDERIYDQIDILDTILKDVIQIKFTNQIDFNKQSLPWKQLDSLVLPALYDMTTLCQKNTNQIYLQLLSKLEIKSYIYYVVGTILVACGFIIILTRLIKISKSLTCIMETFTQFIQSDLKTITKYCNSIYNLFYHLGIRYDSLKILDDNQYVSKRFDKINSKEQSQRSQDHLKNLSYNSYMANLQRVQNQVDGTQQGEGHANLNKKVKKIQIGKYIMNMKFKSIIFIAFFMVFYVLIIFGFTLYIETVNKQIVNFEQFAAETFKFYPVMNIFFMAYKQRALKKEAFEISKYEPYYQILEQMKHLKQIAISTTHGKFDQLYNNIFFDNFCIISPESIQDSGYTSQQCNLISESHLKHGIQSFLFYFSSKVSIFFSDQTYDIDSNLARNLQQGLEISNIALEYLAQAWEREFIGLLSNLQKQMIIIFAALIVIQVILYVILIQILTIGHIKESYIFFRKIYQSMMPQFIINKEKIIKAKLQVEGIIKK